MTTANWVGLAVLILIIFVVPSRRRVVTYKNGKKTVKYKEDKSWQELKVYAWLLLMLWALIAFDLMPDLSKFGSPK